MKKIERKDILKGVIIIYAIAILMIPLIIMSPDYWIGWVTLILLLLLGTVMLTDYLRRKK